MYCRTETQLHDGGTPVCGACSLSPIVARLQWDLAAATERADAANAVFKALTRALRVARQALMAATLRLSDYLNHGTIPEDLKR